jgi:subtilisin family serine protease
MIKLSRFFNIVIILVMLMAAVGMVNQPAKAAVKATNITGDMQFVPGEVIVMFQDGKTPAAYTAQASALAEGVNAQVVKLNKNTALLSFAEDADVQALVTQLGSMQGVIDAEPNYIWSIPEQNITASSRTDPTSVTHKVSADGKTETISVANLRAMRTVSGGKITALYPNDPLLLNNWGWSWIESDIVWPNVTASAGVCELDTGVDYTHPDLSAKIVKGLDFVNTDADPMDDNGHGTHVAGIIAASQNNGKGIAGVSNGKVVAVKVLDAQGYGSFYDIGLGIRYCADRSDIKVLSMSLGGSGDSDYIYNAIWYAVITKGKLLVAAAGNTGDTGNAKSYPGAYSDTSLFPEFTDTVLSVAAEDSDAGTLGCRAPYSTYGPWVSVVAPGSDILSTTPYSAPFYLNYYYNVAPQYDYLSGTSMATPFVAGAAARRWGYKPAELNYQIGWDITNLSPFGVIADDSCWPSSMGGIREVDVAAMLDRGAASGYVYNATTGLPLANAQFLIYPMLPGPVVSATAAGTGLVTSAYSAYAVIFNVPAGKYYTGKVNLSGVTAGPQWAFFHTGGWSGNYISNGMWNYFGYGAVPNKTSNFDVVLGWGDGSFDLDLNIWIPYSSTNQPSPYVVGPEGDNFSYIMDDYFLGSLNGHPYVRFNREGGAVDPLPLESSTISKRLLHTPYAANPALPYYPGTYWAGVYGRTNGSVTDLYFAEPNAYIWKDGIMKLGGYDFSCASNWWMPFSITSGVSGAATILWEDLCGSSPYPYSVGGLLTSSGGMSSLPRGSGATTAHH